MLFVKAAKVVTLSLIFFPITSLAIVTGIVFASVLKSVSYLPDSKRALKATQNTICKVRTYLSVLRVRINFFIEWVTTPFSVIMFVLFVPVNFVLFIVYIPLLYIFIVYWIYKITCYSVNYNIKEITPYKDFRQPNNTFSTYTYYLKSQTFYRAYLVSFSVVYNVLKFLSNYAKNDLQERSKYYYLIFTIILIVKILFWLIIRIVTSLPRAVIVDSYYCSSLFIIYNPTFKSVIKGESSPKIFFYTWITSRFGTSVIFYLNDKLVPIMRKRIFKTYSNKYNFNPKRQDELIKIISKIQDKLSKVITPAQIENIRSVIERRTEHGFIKSTGMGKTTSHPTALLNLNKYHIYNNVEVECRFTYKNPNNIIAVTQTSNFYNNKDKLKCVSHTLFDQYNISTTHPKVTSVLFNPQKGYIYVPYPPVWYTPNGQIDKAIYTRELWETSGISKSDLISSIIFNPDETNKIIYNLEENSIPINLELKNIIGVLTDSNISSILSDLTPEESQLVTLVIIKSVYPEKFDKIVNYYTKHHVACNTDTCLD